MADGRIARNALGQFHAFGRQTTFKQLLRSLVREVEANLQVDHRLADDAEAEVPGLDDARVNRADWNLINSFATDRQKRKGRAVVLEIIRRPGVLAQREVIFRPESVSHERSRVRRANCPERLDAEQVVNLALEARSGVVERGQRSDRQPFGRDILCRMQKPVLAALGEQVVNFKNALIRATIIGDHEDQFGVEIAAQKFGQRLRISARDPAMQFGAALDLHVSGAALEMFDKSRLQSRKVSHRETILTIWSSSFLNGSGNVRPKLTSAATLSDRRTRGQMFFSPTATPSGGGP